MKQWEYYTTYTEEYGGFKDKILNRLGKDGWELIQVEPRQLSLNKPLVRIYYFKREKEVK